MPSSMDINGAEKEMGKPSYFRAYLAVISTSLLHLSTGAVMAWSSPMLSQLDLTSAERTLIGSLYSLGAAPGPFVVSLCYDTIGRKGTLYVLWSTFVVSWILLLSTKDVMVIYIARVIGGIGVGGCCSGIAAVVTEFALTDIRGRLGSLSFMFTSIGMLIVVGIGPYISYYAVSIYGLVIALVFFVTFIFVPESAYYYIRKERRQDAKKSLQRLRGYNSEEALEEEIQEIERVIYLQQNNVLNYRESMRTKAAKKGIAIGIYLVLVQQFTGGNAITAYCQSIFENAHLNFPATILPLVDRISSLFGFLSVVMVNRCLTMKSAIMVSGMGCGISLAMLGLYFLLINSGVNLYNYSFISALLLIGNNIMFYIGVGPLIWPLVAEVLPPSIKGIGTGICGFISSLAGFVIIALFSTISEAYSYTYSFFGLAVLLLGSIIPLTFIVPDTTGKSLEEIQDNLNK